MPPQQQLKTLRLHRNNEFSDRPAAFGGHAPKPGTGIFFMSLPPAGEDAHAAAAYCEASVHGRATRPWVQL